MKKLILRYLPAFACLAAVMLYSCSDEETTQAVVDPYNGHEYVDLGLSVMWAMCKMGGEWRMPTIEEIQALCDKTTSVWTNDYKGSGIAGCIITGKGKYADRTMFLPAAGIFSGTSHSQAARQGYYWSSTLHNGSNGKYLGSVFGGSMGARGYEGRYFGFPMSAVFTVAE